MRSQLFTIPQRPATTVSDCKPKCGCQKWSVRSALAAQVPVRVKVSSKIYLVLRPPVDKQRQYLPHAPRQGYFKDWVNVVKELYRLRNSVAHTGKLKPGAANQNVGAYVFATNALFAYCREQRAGTGIADYSYPTARRPYDQIVALKDGEMYGETSPAVASWPDGLYQNHLFLGNLKFRL